MATVQAQLESAPAGILADGATIRETVLAMGFVERGEISLEQLDAALDVESMTHP